MAHKNLTLEALMQADNTRFSTTAADINAIIQAIARAGKKLIPILKSSNAVELAHHSLVCNDSGDITHQLDELTNNCFINALMDTAQVGAVISEESSDIIPIKSDTGEYIVALDPLDGSANLMVHGVCGSIFAIYQRLSPQGRPIVLDDVLQPGIKQLAAGYILYSTQTILVYGTQDGVQGFTYEPELRDFILTHPAMQIPVQGTSYSINDGYFNDFAKPIQLYIEQCRQHKLVSRYSGALVADFHRHLLQGGIYLYPPTSNKPNGKLRLMFECNPLAFLANKAGGLAYDGVQDVLHIQPHAIHQTIPFYVGSKKLVKSLVDLIKKPDTD